MLRCFHHPNTGCCFFFTDADHVDCLNSLTSYTQNHFSPETHESHTDSVHCHFSIAHAGLLSVCESVCVCACGCVHSYSDVGQQSSEDMSHSEVDLWRRLSRTPPHPALRCQHCNAANGQHHSNRLRRAQWKYPRWIFLHCALFLRYAKIYWIISRVDIKQKLGDGLTCAAQAVTQAKKI